MDEIITKPIATANEKKKLEFSKVWLIMCFSMTFIFCAVSYILSLIDKNPVESLSIAIVQALFAVDGVSFAGYNVQNCIRAYSYNKFESTTTVEGGNERGT